MEFSGVDAIKWGTLKDLTEQTNIMFDNPLFVQRVGTVFLQAFFNKNSVADKFYAGEMTLSKKVLFLYCFNVPSFDFSRLGMKSATFYFSNHIVELMFLFLYRLQRGTRCSSSAP